MTGLKFMRAWRVFLVAVLAWNVVMFVWDAATGNPIVVLPIICVAALVAALASAPKTIRTRTEQMRPRPDYAAIARMERDIYGEAFEHDGAPDRRYRLEGPLPGGVIPAIVQRDWGRDDDAPIRAGVIIPRGAFVILPSGEKIDSAEWARRGGRTS